MGAAFTAGAARDIAKGGLAARANSPRPWHNRMSKILFYLHTLHCSGAA